MRIDHPSSHHRKQLRSLWQQVFGDTDDFLDSFYRTACAPDRCRCVLVDDKVAAALYWIDCSLDDQKLAYIYAVATHPDYRGQGLCRRLMADVHDLLRRRGYAGAVLVPQDEGLRAMYRNMGYQNMGGLAEFTCAAADLPVALRPVGPAEFAAIRRRLLPEGAVLQEAAGLAFLAEQLQFYAGEEFLLAGYGEQGVFHGTELLGSRAAAPGILAALGCQTGTFRTPGDERLFAMFHPLTEHAKLPVYFGFAFD
ncbi:MAG: GNAT family N-acetyltransferase [Faecousia sp.]